MSKRPAPRGARPRQDIRPRVLAALTPEPATAVEIAERARLPGRSARPTHPARSCGLRPMVSQPGRRSGNSTRWRSTVAAREA